MSFFDKLRKTIKSAVDISNQLATELTSPVDKIREKYLPNIQQIEKDFANVLAVKANILESIDKIISLKNDFKRTNNGISEQFAILQKLIEYKRKLQIDNQNSNLQTEKMISKFNQDMDNIISKI